MNHCVFILLLIISISLSAQTHSSYITLMPTYERVVEDKITTIKINADKKVIVLVGATFEGEVTNLRIDTIVTRSWTYQKVPVKAYYCTDIDQDVKIIVLDLINTENTLKLLYLWDEISIEEYSFLIKSK